MFEHFECQADEMCWINCW